MSRGGGMNNEMWKLARQMNKLMDEWMHAKFRGDPDEAWEPAVDVIESETHVCVLVELAGMSRDEVTLRLDGEAVVLSGSRDLILIDGQTQIHQMELARGPFRRRVRLPGRFTQKDMTVTHEDGLLHIRFKKR